MKSHPSREAKCGLRPYNTAARRFIERQIDTSIDIQASQHELDERCAREGEMPLSGWERAERSDPYYQYCVAGSAVVSTALGAVGTLGNPIGALKGFAAGLAIGYLACPYLAPLIRRKIEEGAALSRSEVKSAAEAMGRYAGVRNASEALKLLAFVRARASGDRDDRCNVDGGYAARQLLG